MSKLRSQIRNQMRDERGASLVFVAVSLSVLLGMAALAVDTGLLFTARTESQRVVDAAALAGAGSLVLAPNDEDLARQTAIDFAAENDVRGEVAVVLPEDVDVDLVNDLVRVHHLRTVERSNPIRTFFARVLGVDETGVATVAAAQAFPGGNIYCPLPITLPDRWIQGVPGSEEWDESEGDQYYPPGTEGSVSYTVDDIGTLFNLFPSQGGSQGNDDGGRFMPSWYYTWLPEPFSGTPEIRDRILSCRGDPPIEREQWLFDESGNKQAVEEAFEDLIAAYPDEHFDDGCNCIRNSAGERVEGSLRYRPIPMFDPRTFTLQGSGPHFEVMNFAGVWIERVDPGPAGKRNVWARFMGFTGIDYANGGVGGGPGSLVKVLKLVE